MSSDKIAVDRNSLWQVLDYFWADACDEYLATAAEDRPCHIFPCLVALVEDMARAGDQDALALVPASFHAAEAKQEMDEVFQL
jgi:hypothetical protein